MFYDEQLKAKGLAPRIQFDSIEAIHLETLKRDEEWIRIHSGKYGEYTYVLFSLEKEMGGTAVKSPYEKLPSNPNTQREKPSRWLGKIGDSKSTYGGYQSYSSWATRNEREMNEVVIQEKLACDIYRLYSLGCFSVPKTRLSRQPIRDVYTARFFPLAVDIYANEGWPLYSLPSLPQGKRYYNSYVMVNEQLHYIDPEGNVETVRVRNPTRFKNQCQQLLGEESFKHLTIQEFREVIKANTDHTPVGDPEIPVDKPMRKIETSLRVMSKWVYDYHNLKNLDVQVGEEVISFMEYLDRFGRPPETVLVPKTDQSVPLTGLMTLLAAATSLSDTDCLGGTGENAGVVFLEDENGNIQAARTVKIDPGFAFSYGSATQAGNWRYNTRHPRLGRKGVLKNVKNIQYGNTYGEIEWDKLTEAQKKEFIEAKYAHVGILNQNEILEYVFYREGKFHRSETERLDVETAQKLIDDLKAHLVEEAEIYREELAQYEAVKQLHEVQFLKFESENDLAVYLKTYYLERTRFVPDTFVLDIQHAIEEYPFTLCLTQIEEKKDDQTKNRNGEKQSEKKQVEKILTKDQFFRQKIDHFVLTGGAGSGKTTFCQSVVYQWAKEGLNDYTLIFWIPLRNLNAQHYPHDKNTWIDVLNKECFQSKLSDESKTLLKEVFGKNKCLFILDGYDELSPDFTEERFPDVRLVLFNYSNVWITSRPMHFEFVVDKTLSLQPLTPLQIRKQLEKEWDEEKVKSFLSQLQGNTSLQSLIETPITLNLIIHIWQTKLSFRTLLYENIVTYLFQRYVHKQGWVEIFKNNTSDLPYFLLSLLGYLAFQGMVKGQIYFSNDDLLDAIFKVKGSFIPDTLTENEQRLYYLSPSDLLNHLAQNIGLLRRTEGSLSSVYFFHLSIQEYFAGYYLAQCFQAQAQQIFNVFNLGDKRLNTFVQQFKYNPRWYWVWVYTAGCLAQPHFESAVRLFYTLLHSPPRDILLSYERNLIPSCFEESLRYPESVQTLAFYKVWITLIKKWLKTIKGRDYITKTLKYCKKLLHQSGLWEEIKQVFLNDLNNKNSLVRVNAASLLIDLGAADEHTINIILQAIQDGETQAATALGKLSIVDARVLNALFQALTDKRRSVDKNVIEGVLEKINVYDESAIDILIQTLTNTDPLIRVMAAKIVAKLNEAIEPALNLLLQAIKDKDDHIRLRAVFSLREIGVSDKRVLNALLETLQDENHYVRRGSAKGLGHLGVADEYIINALLQAYKDEELPDVKEDIVEALGKLGVVNEQVGNVLLQALTDQQNDEYTYVRYVAAVAIGQLGLDDERVLQALLQIYNNYDEDGYVRREAAEALVKLANSDERVLDTFLQTLSLGDEYSREIACEMLPRLSIIDERAVNALLKMALHDNEYWRVKLRAVEALGQLGIANETIVNALLQELQHEYDYIRSSSATALGQLGLADERILNALLQALQDDKQYSVRKAAVKALRQLGVINERILNAFSQAMKDDNLSVAIAAVKSLFQFATSDKHALNNLLLNGFEKLIFFYNVIFKFYTENKSLFWEVCSLLLSNTPSESWIRGFFDFLSFILSSSLETWVCLLNGLTSETLSTFLENKKSFGFIRDLMDMDTACYIFEEKCLLYTPHELKSAPIDLNKAQRNLKLLRKAFSKQFSLVEDITMLESIREQLLLIPSLNLSPTNFLKDLAERLITCAGVSHDQTNAQWYLTDSHQIKFKLRLNDKEKKILLDYYQSNFPNLIQEYNFIDSKNLQVIVDSYYFLEMFIPQLAELYQQRVQQPSQQLCRVM